jgi:hypothetical protein
LFDEGGEAFVGLDEVDASLFGEVVECGAQGIEGVEAFFEETGAAFGSEIADGAGG